MVTITSLSSLSVVSFTLRSLEVIVSILNLVICDMWQHGTVTDLGAVLLTGFLVVVSVKTVHIAEALGGNDIDIIMTIIEIDVRSGDLFMSIVLKGLFRI